MSGSPQYTWGAVNVILCSVTFLVPNVGLKVFSGCARIYEADESFLKWDIVTVLLWRTIHEEHTTSAEEMPSHIST